MEYGLFLAAISLTYGMPLIVELGVLFDVLVAVMVLGLSLKNPPLTLSHNDLHPENVFFPTAAGGRFALIDWQSLAATRHGAGDLTRILFNSNWGTRSNGRSIRNRASSTRSARRSETRPDSPRSRSSHELSSTPP